MTFPGFSVYYNILMDMMNEAFVREITDRQSELYSYIYMLLGDLHDARDVLQETNLVLLRKMNDFEEGSNFKAWANRCAYFECLRFRRDRKRDRHVFDDELLALLVDERDSAHDDHDEAALQLALRDCLVQLPEQQRNLIDHRYRANLSIKELAKQFGKKESAVKMSLKRIREALQVCVESKLREVPQ